MRAERLAAAIDLLSTPGVDWGVCVRDTDSHELLAAVSPNRVLPIASVGKLLLLLETARRIHDGTHPRCWAARVRDHRGPDDAPTLALGTAEELCGLMAKLASGTAISPAVSSTVGQWLATNTDLSMVAGGLGLDPLAHVEEDRGLRLRQKTGTDAGVRAEAGFIAQGATTLAYAVLARWDPALGDRRDAVLERMADVGAALVDRVSPGR